jgi:hypothetical protein
MAVRDAIAWIKSPPAYHQIDGGEPGLCLKNVRYAFNIPAKYLTATIAARAQTLHPGARVGSAPRNRPYFWAGGHANQGHVAITDGYTKVGKNLRVWTTDWPNPVTGKRDGKWRRVRADRITKAWHLSPLGWGEYLNDVKIDV